MANVKLAGITWYTRESYAACREIMADKHVLPAGYDEWHEKAEAQVQKWERIGFRIIRVHVDAEEFRAWCLARKLDIDAKARIRFANEFAARQAQN